MDEQGPLKEYGAFTETRFLGLVMEGKHQEAEEYAKTYLTPAERERLRDILAIATWTLRYIDGLTPPLPRKE